MIQGFQLFDSSIDIVLTLIDFGQDITILKMAIFDKVDYIEIEPALAMTVVNTLVVFYTNIGSPFDCQTEMFLRGSIWEFIVRIIRVQIKLKRGTEISFVMDYQ